MYLSYYNLSTKPFQISTDPRFLWLGIDHREALANLKLGLMENNGYVVLIGDVGTGKTTLINALLQTLDTDALAAIINHPSMDAAEFLSFVIRAYIPAATISGKADCLHYLRIFLRRARAEGKAALLVVDEAHRLSETLLEEIRLLSNMEEDGEKLINIIFVGQPELKRKLQSSYCRALRQRITLFYHLQPLSRADTMHYIAHRLKMAGTEALLFPPRSVHAIYKFSGGYPRLINKICDRALLTGYVKEKNQIDVATIRECMREISLIDPIRSAMPVVQRFLLPAKYISSASKRVWAAGREYFVNTGGAAKMETPEVEHTSGRHTIHRGKALFALPVAAALLVAGWMFSGHWNQEEQTGTHVAAQPAQSSEEPTLTGYSLDGPNPIPGKVEQTDSTIERTASPSPELKASPAQKPSTAPPPTVPSMTEIAAAMMAKNDYQAVIAMLETRNGSPAGDSAERGTLYAAALVGRAAQLKDRSPKKTEELLRKAVTADPRSVEALVQLGNLHARTKIYSEAIDAYRKALQLNPQHTDVLFNLGFALANTGMYESAEEMLTRVVQLKPDYTDRALFNLAVVQQKIGKHKESLASLEAAVAIRPQNEQAKVFLKELRSKQEER